MPPWFNVSPILPSVTLYSTSLRISFNILCFSCGKNVSQIGRLTINDCSSSRSVMRFWPNDISFWRTSVSRRSYSLYLAVRVSSSRSNSCLLPFGFFSNSFRSSILSCRLRASLHRAFLSFSKASISACARLFTSFNRSQSAILTQSSLRVHSQIVLF